MIHIVHLVHCNTQQTSNIALGSSPASLAYVMTAAPTINRLSATKERMRLRLRIRRFSSLRRTVSNIARATAVEPCRLKSGTNRDGRGTSRGSPRTKPCAYPKKARQPGHGKKRGRDPARELGKFAILSTVSTANATVAPNIPISAASIESMFARTPSLKPTDIDSKKSSPSFVRSPLVLHVASVAPLCLLPGVANVATRFTRPCRSRRALVSSRKISNNTRTHHHSPERPSAPSRSARNRRIVAERARRNGT